MRFVYQANQDCFFFCFCQPEAHTQTHGHTLFRFSFRSQSDSVSLAEEHTLGCTVSPCACALQT